MPRLERFLFYSFLLHIVFIAGLILKQFSLSEKTYYAVDFYGGGPSGSASSGGADLKMESPAPAAEKPQKKSEPIKEMRVNPKEDLLIKSRVKNKKTKEVVSTLPIPSLPIPEAPKESRGKGNDSSGAPSAIPGASDGSGVGVGFGPDGWAGGGSGGAGNFPYQWYIQTIKKKLDENWNVSSGFSKRIYTQVAFTIVRDGTLSETKIEEKSGNDVFDLAAKRAVEMSGPFPPLPKGFQEPALRVHVRFTVKY